jgi:hypothetical protein
MQQHPVVVWRYNSTLAIPVCTQDIRRVCNTNMINYEWQSTLNYGTNIRGHGQCDCGFQISLKEERAA